MKQQQSGYVPTVMDYRGWLSRGIAKDHLTPGCLAHKNNVLSHVRTKNSKNELIPRLHVGSWPEADPGFG